MPDNLASERRAVRHKLVIFYGSHEPNKSSSDIDEIVDWTYHNGEQAINAKLKQKYKDDLTSVSVKAYVSLPLEAQLKAFYREFDPKKPESDLKEIVAWVNGRPSTGMEEINQRMEKKYGENLNTHAWGGRNHLRELLSAYFAMVDPSRNNPEAIQEVLNTVNAKGALWLERELQDRYRVMLPLAPSDMIPPPPVAMATVDPAPLPPRPKVKSLVASDRARPLSLALSAATMGPQKLTVSEDMEIRGIVEVYYAKHNPEKLTGDGVDQIMRFVRANGLEALNMKMRDKYGEDLDQLKVQYTAALDSLVKYYKEVDPSKQNLEDIAAWAMVHGLQPLSERLEKRYGKGLLPKEDELDPITLRLRLRQFYQIHDDKPKSDEDLDTILSWVLAGSISQLNIKLQQKYGANLTDLPPLEVGEKVFVPVKGAAAAAPLAAKSGLPQAPPPTNSTPKAPQPLGHAASAPAAPAAAAAATVKPKAAAVAAKPLAQATSQLKKSPPASPKPDSTPSPSASPLPAAPKHRDPDRGEETDSFRSLGEMGGGSQGDNYFDEQMAQMRRVTSGQYEGLAPHIRAFYRVHDPAKLQNKEAFDLILKWTFKHGVKALDKKFVTHYGATLDSVQVTEADREALRQEDTDDDAAIDW